MRTNRQLWTRCPNGLWLLMSSSPMEYSPILHHLHAGPPSSPSPPSPSASSSSNHVRNKLFVLCIMLSLWVYMVYCCVGYCATIPTPAVSRSTTTSIITTSIITSITTTITGSEARRGGSLGAPRDLLNDDTEADSRGGGDDWDEGKDMGKDMGKTGLPLNGSDSESQRLPQAIIIGVKKGGTRALLEFLRAHPDIRAVGAEPHFFDRNYHKGLEWYRDLMPKTMEGQLTMEKTPSYYVTKEVPARIYNMSKHTKLIVVVRDPVTRAISDYTQTRSKKPDIPSFESLAFRNATPASGGGGGGVIDATWSAVQIGMYAKHLERWRRYFPAEQLLFVSGEQLISDPAGEMARVQDFLGLRQEVTDRHFHFDAAKGFPCLKRPEGNSKPHCLGKTKGRTHPNIDAAVVQRLREFYQPYNRKFYQMTGHNFGWD